MATNPEPPPGFRFDAFADVRQGRSLFEMSNDDWLVPVERAAQIEGDWEYPVTGWSESDRPCQCQTCHLNRKEGE